MGEKILVVDDEPVLRKFICEVLQRAGGYDVDQASDGFQAVAILKNRRFDLVITDFVMPRMDGVKLLEHVRAMSPQIPVIFITAYLSRESAKTAFPGIECIIKPFGIDDLLSVVRRCLPSKGT
jgi:DNA-binding NtrC family response regulator